MADGAPAAPAPRARSRTAGGYALRCHVQRSLAPPSRRRTSCPNPDPVFLWIYELPTWLFGLLVVGGGTALALFGLALVYRWRAGRTRRGRPDPLSIGTDTVGWFFGGVLTLYGITLGLVTVATWGNYTSVAGIASAEAAALTALYRDTDGYPEPTQTALRTALRDYTAAVVRVAWPAQRAGRASTDGDARITAVQHTLVGFDPRTEGQRAVHQEALRQFNVLVEHRRRRAESVTASIPGVLWAVVLYGAALVVALSYTFPIRAYLEHAWLTGVVTATMALLIFVIATLDHPYRGAVSVSPDAYQLALDHVMRAAVTPR